MGSSHDRQHTAGGPHVPIRRCLGCGAHAPKPTLARFVARRDTAGAALTRDDRAVQPGRGLYVCPTRTCFDRAVERRAFQRAARLAGTPLDIDGSLADAFER